MSYVLARMRMNSFFLLGVFLGVGVWEGSWLDYSFIILFKMVAYTSITHLLFLNDHAIKIELNDHIRGMQLQQMCIIQ